MYQHEIMNNQQERERGREGGREGGRERYGGREGDRGYGDRKMGWERRRYGGS